MNDRLSCLQSAKQRILEFPGVRLLAQSSVYETEPVGVREAYKDLHFLNAVLIARGKQTAEEWLSRLNAIEYDLGRRRGEDRFAPRPIDIDILYYGDQYIDGGGLIVPHPRWTERRFVVQPLAEIRPDLILPGTGETVKKILRELTGEESITLFTKEW